MEICNTKFLNINNIKNRDGNGVSPYNNIDNFYTLLKQAIQEIYPITFNFGHYMAIYSDHFDELIVLDKFKDILSNYYKFDARDVSEDVYEDVSEEITFPIMIRPETWTKLYNWVKTVSSI